MKSLFRRKSIEHIMAQSEANSMARHLNVRDLTFFGIAAIVGAGIFSTVGEAVSNGGPATSLLFIFTAIACAFSALCYAQFASLVPVSGSAYTYSYVVFGELIAWIIGWDLLVEYAIGNIAVAISWSDHFTDVLHGFGWAFPEWLSMDYLSAMRANDVLLTEDNRQGITAALNAWNNAPTIGGFRLIFDLPALLIVVGVTALIYRGIKESKRSSNLLVGLKLLVIFAVIGIGAYYIDPANWKPFAPEGLSGVLKGVAGVFFAYIGFDAISTTAEEAKNPQRDLPKAMIFALLFCTVLYVAVTLVLTGVVNYKALGVGNPMMYIFEVKGLEKLQIIIGIGALIAMTGVLLVFQLGQPRIWMSMGRDGLLPKRFAKIHPKYKTPGFATVVAGVLVVVPTLFMDLKEVTDLTSIGTLFAFVLVSAGVLFMDEKKTKQAKFKIPFINAVYLLPLLSIGIGILALNIHFNKEIAWQINGPFLFFWLCSLALGVLSFFRKLSLIPAMGVLTNLYLMSTLEVSNWLRFIIWLAVGLIIYFLYGRKNSVLAKKKDEKQ